MRAPKFYLTIASGFFMAGKHGYQRKRDAERFKECWIATHEKEGKHSSEQLNNAISITKA